MCFGGGLPATILLPTAAAHGTNHTQARLDLRDDRADSPPAASLSIRCHFFFRAASFLTFVFFPHHFVRASIDFEESLCRDGSVL